MNANTTTTSWIEAALDRCKLILAALACVAVLFSISVGGNLASILCAIVAIGFVVGLSRYLRKAAVTGVSSVAVVNADEEEDDEDDAGQSLMDAMRERQQTESRDMQLSPRYSSLQSNVFHNS
jgi:esterase/lipase